MTLTGKDVTIAAVKAELTNLEKDYKAKRAIITTSYQAQRRRLRALLAVLEGEK